MTDISAVASGAAGAGTSPPVDAAQTTANQLMQNASQGPGGLDTFQLGAAVAKLPTSQQPAVMAALNSQLSPLQQGQLQHYAAQANADKDLPPQYVRDRTGTLQLSSDYAKTACENYNKMMTSNQQIGDALTFGTGGATVGTVGSHALRNAMGGAVGGPLSVIGAVASITTAALAHAPAPPGCVKQ